MYSSVVLTMPRPQSLALKGKSETVAFQGQDLANSSHLKHHSTWLSVHLALGYIDLEPRLTLSSNRLVLSKHQWISYPRDDDYKS